METDFGFYLRRAIDAAGPADLIGGASGYFSAPQPTLDPHLFDGDQLRADVRTRILDTLYDFWHGRYRNVKSWTRAWLAGSGTSYQWAGDRGNGDLDVLLGIDLTRFFRANDQFRGLRVADVADLLTQELKADLWPKTANTNLNGQSYEVTYYVNPETVGDNPDIREINPYAAYDLLHGSWTVRPPQLPDDPAKLFPRSFYRAVEGEATTVQGLLDRYNELVASPDSSHRDTGLALVTGQARALFDDIHLGRRSAFGAGGEGYGDFANFRWQRHKQLGTIQALSKIVEARHEAINEHDAALYGAPILSAHEALERAAVWAFRDRRSA